MRKESGVARSSWQVQWACGTVSLENSHTNHKAMGYFLKTIYLNNLECSVYCCRRVFCSPEYWINNAGKLHSQRWHVEQLKIRPSERSKQRGFIISHLFLLRQASQLCTSVHQKGKWRNQKLWICIRHGLQAWRDDEEEKLAHLEMALDMRYGKPLGAHELENELRRSLCNSHHKSGN